MTTLGTMSPKTAEPPRRPRLLCGFVCRILGHRWHFLHSREAGGKVYQCTRCCKQAVFIR